MFLIGLYQCCLIDGAVVVKNNNSYINENLIQKNNFTTNRSHLNNSFNIINAHPKSENNITIDKNKQTLFKNNVSVNELKENLSSISSVSNNTYKIGKKFINDNISLKTYTSLNIKEQHNGHKIDGRSIVSTTNKIAYTTEMPESRNTLVTQRNEINSSTKRGLMDIIKDFTNISKIRYLLWTR